MQQVLASSTDHDDLQAAFRSLARVSAELDASYRSLETRMVRLNEELALSRDARLLELAEKERLFERLTSLMALLPGGVMLLDAQQRVCDANPEAHRMLGEPLLGELWSVVQARAKAADGEAGRPHFTIHSPALSHNDEQLILVTDTTEVHQLQRELQREQRLRSLGEMAARLAHQIRTPLASATLYLTQLRRGDLTAVRRGDICDRLGAQFQHMDTLIESLLGFVRDAPTVKAPVYVQDLFADLRVQLAAVVERDQVSLDIMPVDRSLVIAGSRETLVGTLANLVMNAIDASGQQAVIEVWAGAASRDRVLLRVRDEGSGIQEAALPCIFDPFFTTREQGTGLGLAVAARTVALHGGCIQARNRPTGGAEFLIELPLLNAEELA
jgi:two-component system sensor histidine kinase FlrB